MYNLFNQTTIHISAHLIKLSYRTTFLDPYDQEKYVEPISNLMRKMVKQVGKITSFCHEFDICLPPRPLELAVSLFFRIHVILLTSSLLFLLTLK